jgi:hypothetical protein
MLGAGATAKPAAPASLRTLIALSSTGPTSREKLGSAHQQLIDTSLKGSRLSGQVEELRFLNPEVALMFATGAVLKAGHREPSPEAVSIQTIRRRQAQRRVSVRRLLEHTRSSSVLPAGVNRPEESPITADNHLIHPTS